MNAAYASRYETVFLCLHPKGPKMSYEAAAKYMKKSKTFVSNKTLFQRKNIDLLDRGFVQKPTKKEDRVILTGV